MKLTPLGDRVVLKQLVAEETTKSGIVIPGTVELDDEEFIIVKQDDILAIVEERNLAVRISNV